MSKDERGDRSHDRLQRIVQLLEGEPSNAYSVESPRMGEAFALMQEIIADRLTGPLNQAMASRPQATLADKQHLVRWANEELRAMGLAIRCPKTGSPAVLAVHPGHHPDKGRFQIALIVGGHYQPKTVSSQNLFQVGLMPRQKAGMIQPRDWRQRSTPKQDSGQDLTPGS